MRQHFTAASAIREAVIAGKQENIFNPARTLVYLSDVEQLPPEWQGPIARMQDAAERLKASQDMVTAAAATADIGTSCGLCHQQLGGPSVDLKEPPTSDGSIATRMQQHAWATERLWEGLYVPSEKAWYKGIAVLEQEEPFPEEFLSHRGGYARTAAADFANVVETARSATNAQEKAAVYAKLLATCAVCHLAKE